MLSFSARIVPPFLIVRNIRQLYSDDKVQTEAGECKENLDGKRKKGVNMRALCHRYKAGE